MATSTSSKKPLWMWGGVAGLIALALGVAVWSTRSTDATVSQGTAAVDGGTSSAAETQPVTVEGATLPVPPETGDDPALGMRAPTLRGFDFDGAPFDTAATGRPKMLVFLAHWCPHCNREIPVLQSWAAAGGVPTGLDIVGVSTAVNAQRDNYPPSKWVVDKAWTWPVLADSAASDAAVAYGVAAFPTFVVVGADGTVKVRSSGELPVADLDAIVRQAIDS
jgi:cytochrome c biogenesis protein CcmG/thiol:disulfide interchange protein DsbE